MAYAATSYLLLKIMYLILERMQAAAACGSPLSSIVVGGVFAKPSLDAGDGSPSRRGDGWQCRPSRVTCSIRPAISDMP
jgi:hypothetical protein